MEDFNWIFQFLGRLHTLTVHFPVGLLVVGLFLELFTIGKKRQNLRPGIHCIIYLGALFAVLAALLGWLLRTYEDYSGDLVDFHQNMGIATAILGSITAVLLWYTNQGKLANYLPYRSGLAVTVVLLTVAGHLGASLTHGEDYLTSVLPGNQKAYDDSEAVALLAKLKPLDSLSELQQDELNLGVRAIFAHNCYQCHGENKKKGELVLENKKGVFKGGESGPVIMVGNAKESELYKRITLPPDADGVMPKKGKTLKKHEVSLIKMWIDKGAHWSDKALKIFPEAELALAKPQLPESSDEPHPVDKLIDSYFDKQGVDWSEIVEDRIFIRRAYMDIIGLLPEPEAIAEFRKDTSSDKREKLIDTLLKDDHNYTQHWLSFWNDLLRNDYSGTGFITGGRKQITDWLYNSLLDNKPYDLMVQELVDPIDGSEGFIKGIQWRGVVNASQRTEMQAAQNIGQSLMGVNVKCASCHNSFVSNLTLEQSYGFASIFADSVLELNRCDKPLGKMATVNFLYPELGNVEAESVKERLAKLSEVMVKPENGRLYRTITNRFWERLMGRGLIEPLDEMDNTPWDADLLDWLAADFIENGHDLKHLIRRIMTSKAYQLPTEKYERQKELKSDYVFEGPTLRRLSAEQFSDAVSQIIAPMYRALAYDPSRSSLSSKRIWHRELKFDRDVLPDPGKRYFRHQFSLPRKEIRSAETLISVDHSYTLFINGKEVSSGTDWRLTDKIDVGNLLSKGKNLIAIEGENEGAIANPAGILFALNVTFADGSTELIQSDKTWKSTAERPDDGWTELGYNDIAWVDVRNFGDKHWDQLVDFSFEADHPQFARASLVRQHEFLKSLGRPSRENVTTKRDDQATLLQALELTNGAYFNGVLAEGADAWIAKYSDEGQMVETLYQKALGRKPTEKESQVALNTLQNAVPQEALQDIFWSTVLLPEFQFIY